jgi:D-alanine-D-alanine ligase
MGSQKLRIGVIFGGRSGEHKVSIMSAQSVLTAIDRDKFEVVQIGITKEGSWFVGNDVIESFKSGKHEELTPAFLLADPSQPVFYRHQVDADHETLIPLPPIDVYFPILHGTFGEDGTLQGLFEMAGVAYVGAGVVGSAVGMDKGIFKDVMIANGIPVADSVLVLRNELSTISESIIKRIEKLGPYPLFTKPANMGSSVGISKCWNSSDLIEGLMEAAQYDRRILVEKGVEAREIEISVLGNEEPVASVPGEIQPEAEFYSYEAKYHDDRSQLFIPADIDSETSRLMREDAIKAYKAIDCAGMARVDFLLDKRNRNYYINEVNTIPGFTKISMYPKLWEASGIPYKELINKLIDFALERREDRNQNKWSYSMKR